MDRGRAFWVCCVKMNVILSLVGFSRTTKCMWTLVQRKHIFKTRIHGAIVNAFSIRIEERSRRTTFIRRVLHLGTLSLHQKHQNG